MRVFFLVLALGALTWYGKVADNPFSTAYNVCVLGADGGYTIDCGVVGKKQAWARVSVLGALPPDSALSYIQESLSEIVWESVYPYSDSIRAILLTFAGATIMVCDSAILENRQNSEKSRFWEKLDLIVIPPSNESEILAIRERFRPRLLAVLPPCGRSSMQNIICNYSFRYGFEIKRGKLIFSE